MAPFRTELITTAEALAGLHSAWLRLWQRAPHATPFEHPSWLIEWWHQFQPGRLCSVALWEDERLLALSPAYIEQSHTHRRLLPLGLGISDYLDVLVDPDQPAVGGALCEAVWATRVDWDVWELEELPPWASALALPAPVAAEEGVQPQSTCPILPLSADTSSFGGSVPKPQLRNVRLARNRFERRGVISVETVGAEHTPRFLDELERLHALRWQGRGEAGVLADSRVTAFHRAVLPRLLRGGLASCLTLAFDGQVIGAIYLLRRNTETFAYLQGFDPGFAFESPGTLLVAEAIAEAIRDGCSRFHFLRGQEAYKYVWGAVDHWNQRRSFKHPTVG